MSGIRRQIAKRLGFGLGFWHWQQRFAKFQQERRDMGALNVGYMRVGRQQMERAAERLQPPLIRDEDAKTLKIYFLTGQKFWYQTVFCAYSMVRAAPDVSIRPMMFDDGSLTENQIENIERVLPQAEVIRRGEIEERLDDYMPTSRFPVLRALRKHFALVRKLTDIHARDQEWKLFLDSDMLFFRRPTFLIEWLRSPSRFLHMQDVRTAYSYSDELMTSPVGKPVPERVNAGIVGINNASLDWNRIEYWCARMIEAGGEQYFLEQALTAMIIAEQDHVIAPPDDHVIYPSREEVLRPQAVMHHYVARTKEWYFRHAWKRIAADAIDGRK